MGIDDVIMGFKHISFTDFDYAIQRFFQIAKIYSHIFVLLGNDIAALLPIM